MVCATPPIDLDLPTAQKQLDRQARQFCQGRDDERMTKWEKNLYYSWSPEDVS